MTFTLADYGRIFYRLIFLVPVLALTMICQSLALLTRRRVREIIPILFHRTFLRVMGVELHIYGKADMRCQLFVANHYSWFDVFIIGAFLPICFVAKEEMRHWFFLGTLARLQRSVFVNRKIGKHILKETENLYRRWRHNDNILIFPEATTTPGMTPLSFKGTFFAPLISIAQAAHNKEVLVQPISVYYKSNQGIAMARGARLPYIWLGRVGFIRHFFYTLAAAQLRVDVYINPAILVDATSDRKQLTQECYTAMRVGLDHLIAGTSPQPSIKI